MGRSRSSNKQSNRRTRHHGNKPSKAPFRDRSHPRKGYLSSRHFQEAPEEKQDVISQKFSSEQISKFVSSTEKRLRELLQGEPKEKALSQPVYDEAAEAQKEEADLLELKNFIENIPDRGFAKARALKELDTMRADFERKEREKQKRKEKLLEQSQPADKAPQERAKFSTPGGILLDAWQHEAVSALLEGKNLIVDAPTSAGKTRVIEALLEHKLKEGVRLVYTCPVKSLSNDKYAEFCIKYGKDMVGINTGDFKENLKAPIVLATLETYRNSLLGVEPNLRQMVVVYDEYHYMQDESRGSAWEESIILSPNHSQLILLSASVPNVKDFSLWIEDLKEKPCHIVRVEKRPVPLVDCIYFAEKGWVLADELGLDAKELSRLRVDAKREKRKNSADRRGNNVNYHDAVQPVVDALKLKLGPVVVYAARRADTESLAHTFAKAMRGLRDNEYQEKLKKRLESLQGWEYVPKELRRMISRQAIAYHHSGLIPPGRVAIETLLKEGWLRVCTGTMGISLGVNFAVRSGFVFDETRPSEGGPTPYSNTEIMQMLGRAGRRGLDKQGFSLWSSPGKYALQKPWSREKCRSSLKFDPTTVLSILGSHQSFSYLSEFYRKSFLLRGKYQGMVDIVDNDLILARIYRELKVSEVPCEDIPTAYGKYRRARKKAAQLCAKCPVRVHCHSFIEQAEESKLQKIIRHLQKIKCLEGAELTLFGQIARHFPQPGGLLIARCLATGTLGDHNFTDLVQLMAFFCAAFFKEVPVEFVSADNLATLDIGKQITELYPMEVFPEAYDELKYTKEKTYRDFNMGAASVVMCWMSEQYTWESLVAAHSSRFFSAGDCMMVLFRFATYLQNCSRLGAEFPELAERSRKLLKVILREPLDARNRMLMEEGAEGEKKAEENPSAVEDQEVVNLS